MDSTSNQDREDYNKANDDTEHFKQASASGSKRKQKETASGATSQLTKVKRVLPTRADSWKHFSRTKEDRDRCICHYCEKNFACATKSGTSNLKKHLAICKSYKAWVDGQDEKQPVIDDEGNTATAKVSKSVFKEATNELLVLGELPMAFVESVAWRHFCKKVNLYKPHSRRTATRSIVEMYVERKAALKKLFLGKKQRVSVTTDIWVAQTTGASYMVVTVHYVDSNWKLKKLIIGFKHITDHKGQTISNVLLECLADWGLEKVFCVTVDNATANSSALRRFVISFSALNEEALVLDGEFMHMRCAGHIINLIVKDGMAEIDSNVAAIRNAVAYVRSHTNRLRSFELKVDSGKISRGSLPLDVKTRWNSTYLMLSTALNFRVAFDKMDAEDKLYNDYFLEVDNGAKRVGPPRIRDWKAVEKLCNFLVIFYNSTLVVSASTSLNAHKCYEEIVTIATNLLTLANSVDPDLKTKAHEMYKKLDKYWDGLKNINRMLIIATVFDPSKKMELASMCFDDLYGAESVEAKQMYDSVFNVLRSLFKEYSSRYGNGTENNVQTSQNTQSAQSSRELADQRIDMMEDGLVYQRIDLKYKRRLNEIGVKDKRDELEIYLNEPVEIPNLLAGMEFDVLSWWKKNSSKYPILSEIARDVLAMQVSSVASESAFSTSGRILDPYRSCLTHYMVEVLMCTEQWMKQDIRMESKVLTNAEILKDLEEEEKLERGSASMDEDED